MLSIIVPCYNSRPYIRRLLDSIVKQHYKDLEVVLADDHSPEPFDDIVKPYEDKLKIVWTKTPYHLEAGCPGNTRQAGTDAAHGDWITFMDHDDAWYSGAISRVMTAIKKAEASGENFSTVMTDFDEVGKNDMVLRHHEKAMGWTHGKFYRRSWWDEHQIRYKKDLLSHEDIYLSSLVNCCHADDGIDYLYLPITTYKWTAHRESLSHREDRLFIETHFDEWLEATGYVYLEYLKHTKNYHFVAYHTSIVIMYAYFYIMGFMFHDPEGYKKDVPGMAGEYIQQVFKTLGFDVSSMIQIAGAGHGSLWKSVQDQASIAVGGYIPCMTFADFLEILTKDTASDNKGGVE